MADEVDQLRRRALAQVGRLLRGKYTLDALLGIGGMAAVFAATHRNGRRVAVKMLHPELGLNPEVVARFLREGYAANKVGHPGAVAVLDDDVDGEIPFVVMELLLGESVEALWQSKQNRLPVQQVLVIADQLLDVLAAAHKGGIVHRDIKPDNLFLTRDGSLKVLDFGIARVRENTGSVSVTRTGNLYGTPAFMSPEQALGRARDIGAASDLYSTGATLFTLLSGAYVHDADSPNEMLVRTATQPARSLAAVAPELPAPVVSVVAKALAFDRAERWPDAHAMQEAVRDAHMSVYGTKLPHRAPSIAPVAPLEPPLEVARHGAANRSGPVERATAEPVDRPLAAMTAPPTTTSSPGRRRASRLAAAGGVALVALIGLVLGLIRLRSGTSVGDLAATNAVSTLSTASPPPPGQGTAASPNEGTAQPMPPPTFEAPEDSSPAASSRTTHGSTHGSRSHATAPASASAAAAPSASVSASASVPPPPLPPAPTLPPKRDPLLSQ
jgi:serine/threonine protein kinase